MSIRLMTAVFDHGPTQSTRRLMLLALADNANDEGVCWPSIATLARKCAVSEDTARRTLRVLEDEGWVATKVGGGHRSSTYTVIAERLQPGAAGADAVETTPRKNEGGAKTTPLKNRGGTPRKNRGSAPAELGGEPSLNPKENPHPPAGGVADGDGRAGVEVDLFDQRVEPQPPQAGDLVAAWWRGWKRGHPDKPRGPHAATMNRVKGKAREIARTATSPEDWDEALTAAEEAGVRGLWDIVGFLADYRPPQRKSVVGAFLDIAREPREPSPFEQLLNRTGPPAINPPTQPGASHDD